MPDPHYDPLALDRETMRRIGYRTVDMLVERIAGDPGRPLRRATPAEMRARLGGPAPEQAEPFEDVLAGLERDVLPFASRVDHPRFFAFVPSSGTWPGALGDLIASAANVYAGSWMESAGPSQVELEVLGWFKDWIGFPREAAGTLTTGGSASNMTALACAREALGGPMSDRFVVYVSDQAHSSLARAARVLGFRPDQVRVLPSTLDAYRLDPSMLAAAMDADLAAGRTPLFASASAGATNSGSIDPLPELAELCRERGVWLHADAAYGGFAVLTERGREQLRGLELADSVTLDPHKWLYQSYECGCLLVREGASLRAAFEILPDYLRDSEASAAEVNFSDLGLQLTRTSRALKCWMSLRCFGISAFRAAIDRSLDLAELARERIERSPSLELIAPPSLGIVCFRRRWPDADDELWLERRDAALIGELERSGLALLSSTRLHGRYALRLCVLNHTTGADDVERTLAFLESAEAPEAAVPIETLTRDGDVSSTWVDTAAGDDSQVTLLPLFHGVAPAELKRVVALADERHAGTGEVLISEWDQSRDFYVLLEGAADVLVRGELVERIEPGDHFGELAALDWGAGYGYSRNATVRTAAPSRLLVLSRDDLSAVLRELPLVEARIRAAVRQRLRR